MKKFIILFTFIGFCFTPSNKVEKSIASLQMNCDDYALDAMDIAADAGYGANVISCFGQQAYIQCLGYGQADYGSCIDWIDQMIAGWNNLTDSDDDGN